jgi:hypothetical protein
MPGQSATKAKGTGWPAAATTHAGGEEKQLVERRDVRPGGLCTGGDRSASL